MKKVLYFTAGPTATSDELADIAALNAVSLPQYQTLVLNGAANAKYGETNRLVPSDYCAGTVPSIYSAVPVLDPDAIPNQALTDTQVIVENAQVIDTDDGGTVTLTVEDGAITSAVYAAGA